ncbi:epimerase [Pseudomonas simiae]|nr:epimerase [Pseudomonas simiae]
MAADTSTGGQVRAEDEVAAARGLISQANEREARIVFISSQTASAEASSVYGLTKWRIEQEVLAAGGAVVRPGQVYGGPERGLFGTLAGLVRRSPLIPALIPAPCVQPIHVDDLAASILTIVERGDLSLQVFNLGAVQPVSFTSFLLSIAAYRTRVVRLPLPIPVVLLRLLTLVLGRTLSAKLGLERIFSLINLPPMESAHSLQTLGVKLRPLVYGLHSSGDGRRRQVLQEAFVLLSYLLKKKPPASLLKRYAKALANVGKTESIINVRLLVRWPILLMLLDNQGVLKGPGGQELSWRLQVALSVAEASSEGFLVFLGLSQQRNLFTTLISLGVVSLKELAWRPLSLLARPFAYLLLPGREKTREA